MVSVRIVFFIVGSLEENKQGAVSSCVTDQGRSQVEHRAHIRVRNSNVFPHVMLLRIPKYLHAFLSQSVLWSLVGRS